MGESDEEEIQVAAVVDGQAAGILDLQGVLDRIALVPVLHHAEANDSKKAEKLEN
jgi:hypothetical protein